MLSSWRMYEMHLALFLKAGCDNSFHNRAGEKKFKLENMWFSLRNQLKWCAHHGGSDSVDASK
jgi:hypothetical protein